MTAGTFQESAREATWLQKKNILIIKNHISEDKKVYYIEFVSLFPCVPNSILSLKDPNGHFF